MKILVTGWNGRNRSFIPKQVASHLIAAGHEVHGWMWDDEWNPTWNTIYGWVINIVDEFKSFHANPEQQKCPPQPLQGYDLVIHLGANSNTTETNVEEITKQNFDFSLWLLNQCQHHKIPLHYASSASVYGQTNHFQENGPMQPQSAYAWTKYMFDRIVRDNSEKFVSPVIGFRYFNVYSNFGETHKADQASVISKWDNDIQNLMNVRMFIGSEFFARDFIWVKDVCEIHEKMLNVDYKGIVNIGTGKTITFAEIAKIIADKTGSSIEEIPMPQNLRAHYQEYTCADTTTLDGLIDHECITVEEYFDKYY